jgi:hypothetical protein
VKTFTLLITVVAVLISGCKTSISNVSISRDDIVSSYYNGFDPHLWELSLEADGTFTQLEHSLDGYIYDGYWIYKEKKVFLICLEQHSRAYLKVFKVLVPFIDEYGSVSLKAELGYISRHPSFNGTIDSFQGLQVDEFNVEKFTTEYLRASTYFKRFSSNE